MYPIESIRKDLINLKFTVDGDEDYFVCRDLRARIRFIDKPELSSANPPRYVNRESLVVQFAVRKTFDRWSNSVDFEIDLTDVNPDFVNLRHSLRHIRRIIRAKAFDFNKYFYCIQIDPF